MEIETFFADKVKLVFSSVPLSTVLQVKCRILWKVSCCFAVNFKEIIGKWNKRPLSLRKGSSETQVLKIKKCFPNCFVSNKSAVLIWVIYPSFKDSHLNHHTFFFPTTSFPTSCLAVADIPFENITRHEAVPQHPAATARIVVVGGRIRHSVWCDASPLRAFTLPQPVLPVGLRYPIPVRG